MNMFYVVCWILAFIGVALIYVLPWVISLVRKEAASEMAQYMMKGVGIVCSVVGMLALFVKGGLN
ncbi:MAG: hypothetical protein HFI90_06490 [Clostridia bacterium]|nr:hypothetical protein [Clostridia bacterium]